VAILAIIWINNIYILIKYKTYTDKIKTWGLEKLYTNEKATAYQRVTKLDMIRVIVGLSSNLENVSGIYSSNETNFKGENWVKTAELYNLTESENINKKNYKKSANIGETVITLVKAKANIMKLTPSTEDANINSKLLKKIKEEDKAYINEAIILGLLDNKSININKTLNKGELSKLIVQFSEKTAALHYDKNKTIETDPKKFPKTYKQYPYILKDIDKGIYDMPLKGTSAINFNWPNTVYRTRKEIYKQTADRITDCYNTILNVDYKTINVDKLKAVIEKYSLYSNNPGHYINYVDYVKNHKIQIKGSIETYLPITYYDGIDYRVRTKITFEVLSSDTQDNLLLPDLMQGGRVTYLDKKYTLYADVALSQSYNSISQRICIYPINNMLVNDTDRIVQK